MPAVENMQCKSVVLLRGGFGFEQGAPSMAASLQMGQLAHVVEDLVGGYEDLVKALPSVAEQVRKVHKDTEAMAKDLHGKTQHLLHGFEYIQDLSDQIPSLYKDTLDLQTRTLTENIHLVLPEEAERMVKMQLQLDMLHLEVETLAHQRTIVDVLSRPIVNKVRRNGKELAEQLYQQQRRTRGDGSRTAEHTLHNRAHPSVEVCVGEVNTPIFIPLYDDASKPTSSARQTQSSGHSGKMARGVKGFTVVPSAHASLPEEVRALRTQPKMVSGWASGKARRRSRGTFSAVDLLPLTSTMQQRFDRTQAELHNLKDQLDAQGKRMIKDKSTSMRKLKLVTKALEERQEWKDKALLSTVDQLVREAVQSFGDLVDEADILDMVSDILEKVPYVEIEEHVQEEPYVGRQEMDIKAQLEAALQDLPPRHPTASERAPLSTADVSIQAAGSPPVAAEVQTDAPYEHLPVPPPSLEPLPQPSTAPPQVVVQLPAQPSGDFDKMLSVMHTLVNNGHAALQNQQALMLALLSDRPPEGAVPPPPSQSPPTVAPAARATCDCAAQTEGLQFNSTDQCPQPVPVTEVSALTANPEPLQREYIYNTAMGTVLLGGASLSGVYTVQPKPNLATSLREHKLGEDAMHRRRASATFLKAYQHLSLAETVTVRSEGQPCASSLSPLEARLLELASGLAEAIRPRPAPTPREREVFTMNEVAAAIRDGTKEAVRQAVEYFQTSATPLVADAPRERPGIGRGDARPLSLPVTESVDVMDVRRETQRSRRQARWLRDETDHSALSNMSDSLYIDEEFHALHPRPVVRRPSSSAYQHPMDYSTDISELPPSTLPPLLSDVLMHGRYDKWELSCSETSTVIDEDSQRSSFSSVALSQAASSLPSPSSSRSARRFPHMCEQRRTALRSINQRARALSSSATASASSTSTSQSAFADVATRRAAAWSVDREEQEPDTGRDSGTEQAIRNLLEGNPALQLSSSADFSVSSKSSVPSGDIGNLAASVSSTGSSVQRMQHRQMPLLKLNRKVWR